METRLSKLRIFSALMAVSVLFVVYVVGNCVGRCETGRPIAVEQTAAIYSAEMSGTDLNVFGGRYKRISDWLTLRRQTCGAVQSFRVTRSFIGLGGLPCGAHITVVRNGKIFDESITYQTERFIPQGSS